MRFRRVAALLTSTLLAGTMAVPLAVVAAGADAPDDVPDGMEWDPAKGLIADTLEVDARRIASGSGRPFSQVLAQLRAQDRLDGLLASLEDDANFAGSQWVDGELVVMFKGDPPKSALSRLRDRSDVGVRAKSVKYSLRDLERMRADVLAGLRSAGLADDDLAVGIDPRAQQVVATARASGASLKDSVRSKVAQRAPEDAVSLSFTDKPVFRSYTTYGGALARIGTTPWCTTGFTVTKGSTKGVATAGHCGTTMNKYKDWFTGAVHNMTYKNGFVGNWGDFEWFTTSGFEKDDFYRTNSGIRRDVSSVKNSFSIDDDLFGYGRGSPGVLDGTVKYLGIWAGGIGKLVCYGNDPGDFGDSGGPIYVGHKAAGFVTGAVYLNGALRLCFSQARYIDDAIGVSISNRGSAMSRAVVR